MIACVIIASAKRQQLLDDLVVPSTLEQGFDEIVVVGDYHEGAGYRYLAVPPLQRTTNDALVKRDVGALATTSDILVYLSDDHRLGAQFAANIARVQEAWDVLVPNRFVWYNEKKLPLNMGEREGYCGGHAGVFRRALIQKLPWSAGPHHQAWDLLMSARQQQLGARFVWTPLLEIYDVEPGARPWQ